MPKEGWLSENDPNSFANTDEVKATHLTLQLEVDFNQQVLRGAVVLNFDRKKTISKIFLDTRDLTIKQVTNCATKKNLSYTLGSPVKSFGSKLEIELEDPSPQISLRIEYETAPSSTALQWLKPEQTAGKQHPYLFSQCQAIHCRSMIPCQDTPNIKTTYSAEVIAPSELVVLMSAVKQETESCPNDPSKSVHKFQQRVPMPSYLIAIVAGALESRTIGPRSKVWSEKEMVDDAAYEFSETENMLKTAEDLLGPYVWGVYDLLVLPPSFPYGGMENPCLTFVTPTLLAGDKSLASVVAHEIVHSWMGNLVTTSNWEHFWLNEGNTVFMERKIIGRLNNEQHRHMSAIGGWKELHYQVHEAFGVDHPHTHLVPDLTGVDPDDAFSSIPYEKGSTLLMHLEKILGGPEIFEKFIRAYVEKFKYESISTDQWKSYLYKYFKDKESVLKKVDWTAWFHKPGMPPVKPQFDTTLVEACTALMKRWIKCKEDPELQSFCQEDLREMSSRQVREFLAQLLEQPPLPAKKIAKLDEAYGLSLIKNSEIKFRWIRLCLRAHIKESITPALNFVNEQGRMKFVRPIYRDLYNWEVSRPQALKNYQQYSPSMHSLTATMVGKDLKLIT